jgi:hypothetical protein
LQLVRTAKNYEAQCIDIDAAKRAGWKRPRDIRKLIARLQKKGLLPWIAYRASLARIRIPEVYMRHTVWRI